jgi:hypothetical protein
MDLIIPSLSAVLAPATNQTPARQSTFGISGFHAYAMWQLPSHYPSTTSTIMSSSIESVFQHTGFSSHLFSACTDPVARVFPHLASFERHDVEECRLIFLPFKHRVGCTEPRKRLQTVTWLSHVESSNVRKTCLQQSQMYATLPVT